MDIEQIKALIRDVPDFPEPGIVFKDITPVLADPIAFSTIIDLMVVRFGRGNVDKVVGIEARGFIIASPVAYHFGAGFVPDPQAGQAALRNRGRGLRARVRHRHARAAHRRRSRRASGSSSSTMCWPRAAPPRPPPPSCERVGGKVCGIATVIELEFLHGRERLAEHEVYTLIRY